ncbi:hypothetical protein NAEGRDRAFT_79567 [Naegleria gruberi]|uniref:Uncharacterized protein n=1 Tax=Naegleria gruberi TaxID=5762 RepID=D2VDT3_NAEGR|nr:uncharacterized protein NAEGRDRAFT_79567 [Naegleria gruberi]EFC44954.1 hypothetical protein NAEGRDRAFT_79567 [Naegleria gruberi]|eukprot:XP_002677698.1 hypothetical protein NAEGRDRAFT_79567 [Naegleria gruberi strain NEG-M]
MEKLQYFSILFTGGKGCGKSMMIVCFIMFFIEMGYELKVSEHRSPKEAFVTAGTDDHVTTKFQVARLEKKINNKTIVLELIDSPGIEKSYKGQPWYGDMKETFKKIMDGQVRANSCVFEERRHTLNSTNPDENIPKPMLALVCSNQASVESGNANDPLLNVLTKQLQKRAFSVSTKIDQSMEKDDKKTTVLKFNNGKFEEVLNDIRCVGDQNDLQFFSLTKETYFKFKDCDDIIKLHTARFIHSILDMYNKNC